MKIRDDRSEFVENKQKVKITADVNVLDLTPGEAGKMADCYLTVKKIEKQ